MKRLMPAAVHSTRAMLFTVSVIGATFLWLAATAPTASAKPAWVKGEVRLNLRAGSGSEFKIIGSVRTGDELDVLANTKDWTRIKTAKGKIGWIPAGYLEEEPPPVLRLKKLEEQSEVLQKELSAVRGEAMTLRETNATLSAADSGQKSELEALQLENLELRAGARYQEWITGALILAIGMIVGAIMHRRSANRRGSARIRL